jgi:hypothetical protein
VQVVSGEEIWRLKATHGLPLDFALMELARHDAVPAWDQLLAAARRDGTNMPRLVRELSFSVREAYGVDLEQRFNDYCRGIT